MHSDYPSTPSSYFGEDLLQPSDVESDLTAATVEPSTDAPPTQDDFLAHTPTRREQSPRVSPQKRPHSPSDEPDAPRIPALLAELPSTFFPDGPPPAGSSKTGWPWRYACDVLIGFQNLRKELDAEQGAKIEDVFVRVFKVKFVRSTFYDNHQAYKHAMDVGGIRSINEWIVKGRVEGAEWTKFMAKWRVPKGSGKR